MLTEVQAQAYLDRIGHDGPLDRSLKSLRALHCTHVFSVPFENLDIHLGRHIPVDVAHAYDKVVGNHRGGYCYELNPLFHALLTCLGYDTKMISARVLLRDDGHPFDHVTTIVHLDDDWLVDVGFGRQPPPMPVARDNENATSNENGTFKIRFRDGEFVVMASTDDGKYEELYGFGLTRRTLSEFEERSEWIQTSPESIFTKAPICTLPTENGRVTISGLNFIKSEGGKVEVSEVTSEERDELLRSVFGIDLGDAKVSDRADLNWIPGRGL